MGGGAYWRRPFTWGMSRRAERRRNGLGHQFGILDETRKEEGVRRLAARSRQGKGKGKGKGKGRRPGDGVHGRRLLVEILEVCHCLRVTVGRDLR